MLKATDSETKAQHQSLPLGGFKCLLTKTRGIREPCNNINLTNGLWTLDSEVSGSISPDKGCGLHHGLNWKLCVLTDDAEKLTLSS